MCVHMCVDMGVCVCEREREREREGLREKSIPIHNTFSIITRVILVSIFMNNKSVCYKPLQQCLYTTIVNACPATYDY